MIDLTPLDVRKKRGDFRRSFWGYAPPEVDHFLEFVAERMEELVKENLALQERVEGLRAQVEDQGAREKAVREALVTAQELREEITGQARREAELVLREAEGEARRVQEEVDRRLEKGRRELRELARARDRLLRSFRTFLERELDALTVEEENAPPEATAPPAVGPGGEAPDGAGSREGGESDPDPAEEGEPEGDPSGETWGERS